jgi:hypothetical protein
MRIKSHVTGDSATRYFECLWMDAFSSTDLARVNGHWLVKGIKVSKVDKLWFVLRLGHSRTLRQRN